MGDGHFVWLFSFNLKASELGGVMVKFYNIIKLAPCFLDGVLLQFVFLFQCYGLAKC